ncbi:DNA-binding MarR family transcriptional regulator [Peptoniphilus olsenii]|uniref:DNA-binding MarR family transcriptional regulator n=1 Tax=Peptoniphilus olsenii TaxID=411570 RepID=A0ABV2JB31_9FIRM
MFDLDCCVAFVTNIASKTLSECLNNRLLKYGVTKSQWIAMYYINRHKSLNNNDLAELMGAKQPTISGIIDRLEREKLIIRKEDKKDKRRKFIRLTKKGEEINEELTEIAQDFRDVCLSGIDEKDQETFLQILNKMVVSAEKWDEDTKEIKISQ